MGITVILPLIIGIGLMLSVGTTIAPSIIEDMKISKIENKTIANQESIKDAIIRYIQIEGKPPIDMNDLKNSNLLKDYHNDNLFNQGYTFEVNKEKGIIKIITKIDDNSAMKYFENSFKLKNKPKCKNLIDNICQNNEFETNYLIESEIYQMIKTDNGNKNNNEDISVEEKYSYENLGNKNNLEDGNLDYVVDIPNNKVIEYIYNKNNNEWIETGKIYDNNFQETLIPNIIKFAEKYPTLYKNIDFLKNKTNNPNIFYSRGALGGVPFFELVGEQIQNNQLTKEFKDFLLQEKNIFFYGNSNYYPRIKYPYPINYSFNIVFKKNNSTGNTYYNCNGTSWASGQNKTNFDNYIFLFFYPSGTCGGTTEEKNNNNYEYYYSTKIINFIINFETQINTLPLFENDFILE